MTPEGTDQPLRGQLGLRVLSCAQLLALPLLSPGHLGVTASPVLHVPSDSRCQETNLLVCRGLKGPSSTRGRISHVTDSTPGVSENPYFLHAQCPWGAHHSSLHIQIRVLPTGLGLQLNRLLASLQVLLGSVTSLGISGGHRGQRKPGHDAEPQTMAAPAGGEAGDECLLPTRGDTLVHDPHTYRVFRNSLIFISGFAHPQGAGSSAKDLRHQL